MFFYYVVSSKRGSVSTFAWILEIPDPVHFLQKSPRSRSLNLRCKWTFSMKVQIFSTVQEVGTFGGENDHLL